MIKNLCFSDSGDGRLDIGWPFLKRQMRTTTIGKGGISSEAGKGYRVAARQARPIG